MKIFLLVRFLPLTALLLLPQLLSASDVSGPDTGDTAWILISTALVLFMTIPGLSFFYAGLVRGRNVLSVLMQCFVITALMSILWLIVGYTTSFSPTGMIRDTVNFNSFVGSLDRIFLKGIGTETLWGSIPEPLFFAFQMTFFIITPALMVGAFVERMKFSAILWFVVLWSLLVYVPVCHMVWGGDGGFFADRGVFDFAGGIVVHITAGCGALVACVLVGPRKGYPNAQFLPHNLPLTVAGAGMLWVGWFGFNGGSALGANGSAAMAILVTHISASAATLVWMFIEWYKNGKPSVLGAVTGSIAGLAAVTPASGYVGPLGGLCIGTISTIVCWYSCAVIKAKFRYDDSLDVFGVHGVGGFVGTILVAFFAAPSLGGLVDGLNMFHQLGVQLFAALATAAFTVIMSFVILIAIKRLIGLRVDESQEIEGLDLASHGETGYNSLSG